VIELQPTMTLGDLGSIVVAIVALLLAGVALRISGGLARKSASRPFVLEKLYDLYQYRKNRRLEVHSPLKEDIDRLFKEVQMIKSTALILEAAGLEKHVAEVESKGATYDQDHERLTAPGASPTAEDGERLVSEIVSLDRAVQDLLGALEPQMRRALKDPFDDFKN
jgi:hypothetical protein